MFENHRSMSVIACSRQLSDSTTTNQMQRALRIPNSGKPLYRYSKNAAEMCAPLWSGSSKRQGEVNVGAAAVVSAVTAYAKINANGQWVERTEQVSLNQLFDRMTREEMEAYAKDGQLPPWFEHAAGATHNDSHDDPNQRQTIEQQE